MPLNKRAYTKGWGIGVLNAIYKTIIATVEQWKEQRRSKPIRLPNYKCAGAGSNDETQQLVSFKYQCMAGEQRIMMRMWGAFYFDLNSKKNKWNNMGGSASVSQLLEQMAQHLWLYTPFILENQRQSSILNVWQELYNNKYDKSDLGCLPITIPWTRESGWVITG